MAVIFFEGFNVNVLSPTYWTVNSGNWSSGSGGPRVSGGRLTHTSNDGQLTLSNIGTHSNKKLYVGIGIQNLVAVEGEQPSLMTFYSGATEQFAVYLNYETDEDDFITLELKQGATSIGKWEIQYDNYYPWYTPKFKIVGSWVFLEFEIDMTVTPNTVTLRRDGMVFDTSTSAANVELDTPITNINGLSLHGAFSNAIGSRAGYDDLYVCDNTGATANTWLGVDAVVYPLSLNEGNPTVEDWTKYAPNWPYTALGSNDGDATYIRTAAVDKKQLYPINQLTPVVPDSAVGGVRITSVARNTTLPSAYKYLYRAPDDTDHEMGNKIDLTAPQYVAAGAFALLNPKTNAPWTLADLNDGKWGVKSVTPT